VPTPAEDYKGDLLFDAFDTTMWQDPLGEESNLRTDGTGKHRVNLPFYQGWQEKIRVAAGCRLAQPLGVTAPVSWLLIGSVAMAA